MHTLLSWKRVTLILFAVIAIPVNPLPAQLAEGNDTGWPREIPAGDSVVTVYQPQVDKWEDHKLLHLRTAISVRNESETSETLGVLEGTADTVVNTALKNVALANLKYTVKFPGKSAEESAPFEKVVRTAIPGTHAISMSLDRVLAYMDPADSKTQKEVEASMAPPTIFYSEKPAVLILFAGEPSFSPVKDGDNSLLYAVNTNWDLFQSVTDDKYYLRDGESWLQSESRGANWTQADQLPAALLSLPDNENWTLTKNNIPGIPAKTIPVVYETTTPAELIITNGAPQMDKIEGVNIMRVTNTDSELFLCGTDQKYYFLVAGRWFSAQNLKGPWDSATLSLPAEFAKIPPDGEASEVLASVKGTDEANDAVLLASVPTKATIPVSDASLTVTYDGEAKFITIPGTTVQYAINTGQDVFLINNKYYCCAEGVWYNAAAASGPWALATSVDPAIYTIPVSSPKHNVTYVKVYESTPQTVTYGYTSGYTGSYVSNGLLVFGAGLIAGALLDDNSPYYKYNVKYPYPPTYYSYGIAAHYNYAGGGYYGYAGAAYGPYGGAGRYAAYNPATGVYSRGVAAYGPYASGSARQAYNPWTDTYAARATVNTKNGSASRFYAEQNGDSVWGGSRSNSQGTVAGARTSNGGAAVGWDGKYNEGAAVKNKQGDMVVGNDGNIYKKQDGEWSKYDNGDWQSGNKPNNDLPSQRNNANNNNNRSANGNNVTVNNNKAVNIDNAQGNRATNVNRTQNTAANNTANVNRTQQNKATDLSNSQRNRATDLSNSQRNQTGSASIRQGQTSAANRSSVASSQERRSAQSFDQATMQNLNRQSEARARGDANTQRYQSSRSNFEGGNRNPQQRSFESRGGQSPNRSMQGRSGGGRSGEGRGRR